MHGSPHLQYNIMRIVFLSLILVSLAPTLILSEEIPLTRSSQSPHSDTIIHTLPVSIGKQSFKMSVRLDSSPSWIRSNKCLICKQGKCRQSCEDKIGAGKQGLVCGKGYCQDIEQGFNNTEMEGEMTRITLKAGKRTVSNYSLISAEKIKFLPTSLNKHFDGTFGLVNTQPVFEQLGIVYKNKDMVLLLQDQLPKEYLDKKSESIIHTLSDNGSFKVTGFSLDNEIVYIEYPTYLSLNQRSLVLPEPCYEQLENKVKVVAPGCGIEGEKVVCEESKSLQSLKDVIIGVQIDDQKLQISFSSVTQNCRLKQCDLLIRQSKQMTILLGEVFLLNYAVLYNLINHTVLFHRLNNTQSSKYHQIIHLKGQLSSQHDEFPRTIQGFIWHFIRILFKIGLVIGLYYLMLQFYLNYKEVIARVKNFIVHRGSLYYTPYTAANGDEFSNGGSLMGTDAETASKQFWEDNTIQGI